MALRARRPVLHGELDAVRPEHALGEELDHATRRLSTSDRTPCSTASRRHGRAVSTTTRPGVSTNVGNVEAFDGPQFQAPADGRVRGYAFAFTVTKAGPVQRYQLGGDWQHAGQGQALVGFKLPSTSRPRATTTPCTARWLSLAAGGSRWATATSTSKR